MTEYMKTIHKDELSIGEMKLLQVEDRLVILFRIDDEKFCCIDDICTHDGGTLSDGEYDNGEIACPRHGARFDVCSGKALCMPATRDTIAHDVKVDGDDVFVKISE